VAIATKQIDSFKRQRDVRRKAYAETLKLRERFPEVEQVVLEVSFTDSRRMGTYSAQMHSFFPGAKAFFEIACPRTLCVDGGFDLDTLVEAMLSSMRGTTIGTLECHGWLDPMHSSSARCLLRMRYRLQAWYGASKPQAAGETTHVSGILRPPT
jgi:hypothetical protein